MVTPCFFSIACLSPELLHQNLLQEKLPQVMAENNASRERAPPIGKEPRSKNVVGKTLKLIEDILMIFISAIYYLFMVNMVLSCRSTNGLLVYEEKKAQFLRLIV
jgi:hypothetical protein